jgi:hypothetical protein
VCPPIVTQCPNNRSTVCPIIPTTCPAHTTVCPVGPTCPPSTNNHWPGRHAAWLIEIAKTAGGASPRLWLFQDKPVR